MALVVLVAGAPVSVSAGTSIVASGSPQIYVGAGASLSSIDTIQFTVPGADVGTGAPVRGSENGVVTTTLIDAYARAPGNSHREAVLSVDSSQPLVCATPSTCGSVTIPMTRFRWTVSGGEEIAPGAFNGTADQTLLSFRTSRYVFVYKTFFYANETIVPAGRYTGRVVYTLSMP